jgi:hypothetical protein
MVISPVQVCPYIKATHLLALVTAISVVLYALMKCIWKAEQVKL